jgi:hypothetical protein
MHHTSVTVGQRSARLGQREDANYDNAHKDSVQRLEIRYANPLPRHDGVLGSKCYGGRNGGGMGCNRHRPYGCCAPR